MDPLPHLLRDELTRLIPPDRELNDSKFLLAVSGGMDSMVMAHCFQSLGLFCGVAHFNFQLRGEESDLDEKLVRDFCDKNNIPFHIRSEDANRMAEQENLSIQEMARKLRYDFFEEVMEDHHYDFVCTAHHGNDQLETFFIHLFRGSGLKGLTGIPQRRDCILRPMLWIPHSELEQYTVKHHIAYREDSSNKSDKYLRNRIRHHLIQPITEGNPAYLTKSLDTIHLLTQYQLYFDRELEIFKRRFVQIKSPHIQRIALNKELIDHPNQLFLLKLFLLDEGLYPDSVENLIASCGKGQTGSRYEGQFIRAWYDREKLWLIPEEFYQGWKAEDCIELSSGTIIELPGGDRIEFPKKSSQTAPPNSWMIPIDQDQVTFPLQMRHRKPGDYLELGAPPYFRKSLKKLLNDYKIPRPFKDRIYVLTDKDDRIISIPGLMNSPKYTSNQNSEMVIRYSSTLEFLYEKNHQ